MRDPVPNALLSSVDAEAWRNAPPDVLRQLFERVPDLPDLELFKDVATMRRIAQQIGDGGYVEDAEFCMVRAQRDLESRDDPRLVFEDALFIGGSIVPGDDVFIALHSDDEDPRVLVFDWSKPIPLRWVQVGRLSQLIPKLSEESHG